MHCVNLWILDTFTQHIWAPPLREVLCYSTSNEYNRIMFDFYPGLPYIHVLVLLLYFLFPGLPHFFRFRVASFPGHSRLKLLIAYSMQKWRGEGLGERVTCITSGTCRHGGGATVVTHKPCIDQPQIYQIMSCIDIVFRMLQSQVFGQDIRRRISKFFIRHRPPRVHACDSFSQAFPLHYCILQAIKNWWWEQPGNKDSFHVLYWTRAHKNGWLE